MVKKSDKKTIEIKHFEEINSTNSWLKAHIDKHEHGFVVCTDYQSAGRGQGSNKWESERDKNLLFSLLLEPTKIAIEKQFLLSELISIAITDTLENYLQKPVRIKWPNDIYVGDKKLCGILIETVVCGGTMSKAIVGIGLNVNQETFVSDAPNPVSMRQILGHDTDRHTLLEAIVARILEAYDSFDTALEAKIEADYQKRLYRNSGFYTFADHSGEFEAEIVAVLPTGHLKLRKRNNEECCYAFKEVVFVI